MQPVDEVGRYQAECAEDGANGQGGLQIHGFLRWGVVAHHVRVAGGFLAKIDYTIY